MGIGDKITWAYRSLILIGLVWLRFIEKYIPVWGALIVWLAVMVYIVRVPGEGAKKPSETSEDAVLDAGDVAWSD
jgi:hypothetical protein